MTTERPADPDDGSGLPTLFGWCVVEWDVERFRWGMVGGTSGCAPVAQIFLTTIGHFSVFDGSTAVQTSNVEGAPAFRTADRRPGCPDMERLAHRPADFSRS